MTRGLLLVGHGTRDQRGQAEFLSLAAAVAARTGGIAVQPAFLELVRPGVEQGLRLLARSHVQHVVIQPLMLFAAGHVKRDLPSAVQAAAQPMHVELMPHLGCHPALVRLSVERFVQASGGLDDSEARETLTILVGRGTSDADGQAEFVRFAQLRCAACPTGGFEHCFVAAAEPGLEAMLLQASTWHYKRVVVQPHLLFRGEVYDSIAHAVERVRRAAPQKQWLLAPHLGPDLVLAEMMAERALRA